MDVDLDHLTATDEIINWCQAYEPDQAPNRLLSHLTSNLVLRLNDAAVVKFALP